MTELFDAIVVGGGPADLNAALVLGRCRRMVLVLDEGKPSIRAHSLSLLRRMGSSRPPPRGDGLRELAEFLRRELPESSFEYSTVLVEGEIAFLEWKGRSASAEVDDGADSYLIRDGKIIAQTIHYTFKPVSIP